MPEQQSAPQKQSLILQWGAIAGAIAAILGVIFTLRPDLKPKEPEKPPVTQSKGATPVSPPSGNQSGLISNPPPVSTDSSTVENDRKTPSSTIEDARKFDWANLERCKEQLRSYVLQDATMALKDGKKPEDVKVEDTKIVKLKALMDSFIRSKHGSQEVLLESHKDDPGIKDFWTQVNQQDSVETMAATLALLGHFCWRDGWRP